MIALLLSSTLTLQATLTLGPASLGYAELAQALTHAGIPCVASPSLADRGAFVCLRNRTPETARRLLGEGLGVAFVPEDGGWRMVADPEAKERDRLRLIRYRRLAQERARDWAKERTKTLGGRSYAAFERSTLDAIQALQALPAGPEGRPQVLRDLPRALDAASLLDPGMWVALQTAREGTWVGAAIEGRATETHTPIDRVQARYGVPPDRLRAAGVPNARIPEGIDTDVVFDPRGGVLTIRAWGTNAEGSWSRGRAFRAGELNFQTVPEGAAYIPADGPTLDETFARLEAPLPPAPELPDAPEVANDATLSIVLERLGAAGVEAVMELSPRFEPMPLPNRTEKTTLRGALTAPDAPPASRFFGTPAWAAEAFGTRSTKADLSRLYPWRASLRDGAWIVTNPFAFLDRAQWVSPVPYLAVERIVGTWPKEAPRGPGDEPLLAWPRLVELAKVIPPGFGFRVVTYRSLFAPSRIADLLPIVRAVETIPLGQRAGVWRAAMAPQGVDVRLAGGTLHLLAQRMDGLFGRAPFGRIRGDWRGDDGRTWSAVGNLDPTGILP